MNGKKKKNKKLVLDSGKVSNYLSRDLDIKSLKYEKFFYLKKFNIDNLHFFRKK